MILYNECVLYGNGGEDVMRTLAISRTFVRNFVLFGLAALVINMLTLRYLANADLENIDLGYMKDRTVVIDPGHGGIDSGAKYNQLLEKEITLAIGLKLGEILKEHGANVIYTRDSDVDYYTKGKGGKRNDLLKRVDMINDSSADLFVSVHCNAVKGAQWFGSQVFYNPKFGANKQLAEYMQELLKKFPPNNKRMAKEDMQILILNASMVPGVLVETGYLSNKNEAAMLADAEYQNKLAMQIAKSIAYYFKDASEKV